MARAKKTVGAGLSVGRVAERAGVSVSTLHFYESKGLIFSSRNAGNQRRYEQSVLRRIAVIKTAQRVGISLQEIRSALASLPNNRTPTKADWAKLSRQWQADLDQRIADMTHLRDELTGCIGCGCLSLKSCGLRNPDDSLGEVGHGAVVWADGEEA